MICPHCQSPISPGLDFCLHCGTEVRGGPAALEDSAPGLAVPPPSAPRPSTPPPSAPLAPAVSTFHAVPTAGPGLSPLLYAPQLPWRLRLLGPVADPTRAVPYSRAQGWLRRTVGPRNATRPWFTALVGAVVALLLGLALMLPGAWIWRHGLAAASGLLGAYVPGAGVVSFELLPALPLDPIELLFLALHVPFEHALSAGAGAGNSTHLTLSPPLTGLLLLPALALTLGGYLSAASEYGRVPRYAIARGALLGPLYGALLFALAFVAARSPTHPAAFGSLSLAPLPAWALFYGTLWGALFGALGGWLHVSGRACLAAVLPTLRGLGAPRVAGALAGAGAALLCALLLTLALLLGAAAFTSVHAIFPAPAPVGAPAAPGAFTSQPAAPLATPDPLSLAATVAGVLVAGVPFAFWLLSLGSGAPWEAALAQASTPAGGGTLQNSWSLGFIGAQHALPRLALLLALVPALSYLVGGRIAARVAGAHRREDAFAAGAAISVPLSLLLAGLAWLVAARVASTSGVRLTESVGPSVAGTAIATLLLGGLVGGVGGVSALRAPWLGRLPSYPLAPLRALGRPLVPRLDRLTGHRPPHPAAPISPARRWLYDAVLLVLLLGLLTLAADGIVLAWPVPTVFQRLRVVDGLLAALLVAQPLLCGLAALLAALAATEAAPLPAFGAPLRPPVYLAVPRAASLASPAPPLPAVPSASIAASAHPAPASQRNEHP